MSILFTVAIDLSDAIVGLEFYESHEIRYELTGAQCVSLISGI